MAKSTLLINSGSSIIRALNQIFLRGFLESFWQNKALISEKQIKEQCIGKIFVLFIYSEVLRYNKLGLKFRLRFVFVSGTCLFTEGADMSKFCQVTSFGKAGFFMCKLNSFSS